MTHLSDNAGIQCAVVGCARDLFGAGSPAVVETAMGVTMVCGPCGQAVAQAGKLRVELDVLVINDDLRCHNTPVYDLGTRGFKS